MKVELSMARLERGFVWIDFEALSVFLEKQARDRSVIRAQGQEIDKLTDELRIAKANPVTGLSSEVVIVLLTSVCKHLTAGSKINAIKEVRTLIGCSLKDAKDIVEGTYSP